MGKILFSDLDGTLLTDDKKITDGNRAAVEELIKSGGYFAISTGRPLTTTNIVINDLDLNMPGCYAVCFNGGLVYDCYKKETVFEKRMPISVVHEIFELAEKNDIYVQTYEDNILLGSRWDENLLKYINTTPMDAIGEPDVLKHLKSDPYKCLGIDVKNPEKLAAFARENKAFFDARDIELLFSMNYYLEIAPKGISKAGGNGLLAKILNISNVDTVAAGDERNDISMIRAAGVGAAMKNARPEVIAVADYVTEHDNNHDGIKEVIDKFLLN